MTLDRHDENPPEDAEHGVLSDTGSLDSAGIGLLGTPTAQLRVVLPVGSGDDDLDDDDVIGDEIRIDEIPTGEIVEGELPAAETADDEEIHDAEDTSDAEDIYDAEVIDDEVIDEHGAVEASGPADVADAENRSEVPEPETGESEAAGESDEVYVDVELDDVSDTADGDDGADVVAETEGSEADAAEAPVEREPEVIDPADDAEERAKPNAGADESATSAASAAAAAAGAPVTTATSVAAVAVSAAPLAPRTGSVPTTRREANNTGAHQRIDRDRASERVVTRDPEVTMASKRLGEFDGSRESSDLLTPDRLLDRSQLSRPEPEGLWQQLVYSISGHRINLGDGQKARARKELDRLISAPLSGGARFVPVLSRKGGVGKTTITALLGMALADARDDRVIAVDANPDRGTLADRISRTSSRTVRDLVRGRADVTGYADISALVARDETRLDVLSSDADPRVSEAFNDRDYRDVAELAAHYYSLVLTDTGTGIVHSVMGATLDLSDQLVIVAGLSVDEARLASETLTWLETNGYARQAREAVVVLNNARPGAPLVRESELEGHFRTRVRSVVRVPYDTAIGTGSAIVFRDLQPATRKAARELAAAVIGGLRAAPEAA
ncbi:MinD-like ATPase involved in chromosome partitioning or flagellar assembly [Microbacterium sp. AG1240]|uniref:MinD/ParA family ATP-binding protein n=1 Tax=Microbacterium sp. AG1240 TaxID=2183992 RepID=UPI000F148393|nr:MinD/ParA family protein [Microbacterium sp. AG1240]RKT31151.1 MinD-like ATPase involved in chromosome partitioning or flagellar assembly [Microbacterium sp. AG1240]